MSYNDVRKELAAGMPAELICAACPWDRLCVRPPTMTKEQIDGLIKDAETKDRERDPAGSKLPAGMLMTALTFAGKDNSGEMCPVFALRLRTDRKVADGVRDLMREYGGVS